MDKVTVGTGATLVAAASRHRGVLTVQHIDVGQAAVRVWLADSDAVTVGNGMVLTGLGVTMNVNRMSGAKSAWYAVAEEAGVDVIVQTGNQWDSQP